MGNVEIPNWLEGLPLAPEFRPTETEFSDPIAYISKIEKESSTFGICKIIPPLPKPSKKYVFSNLNRSLLKCPELGQVNSSLGACNSLKTGYRDSSSDCAPRAVFTTRQQELGQSVKKAKGAGQNPISCVQKQVWQSGEVYTLEQFESKSKTFARSILGTVKDVSPLDIEAMFWKAASEKPIYIEYANDVPGSAFGESKGEFCYSPTKQRRKTCYKSRVDTSDCKQTELNSVRDAKSNETMGASSETHAGPCLKMYESAMPVSTFPLNEASQCSSEKSSEVSNDIQGRSGWKLSNSPWNLQSIAHSSGSLTRFMPDNIPGVTSPMVYIGMLFSWFAWHVEDHELHSMNFLHTGSSKTWYSVPGDYAFAFEEVIRCQAYGDNIDHLAALKLLGEKTTLLSPEIIIASGIPCCRLIQNPGEFVVTFPRAYHVGFSHGFNCGEAANFGTPEWLTIAKEAAVRRAVMNYLPMLSHQQLLYLLTMSFIPRVPRTLLPGARSSRLKDRQKEERELLVKKAFIEDMLQENKLISILLGKEATKQAVLWNADLLPNFSKHCQLSDLASTTNSSVADMSNSSSDKSSHYLFDETSLYMENQTDLYLGDVDDDLSRDFQTDSGPLACVGCGVLGFPFMTVVQPSEKLTVELFPVDHHLVQDSSPNSTASLHSSVSTKESSNLSLKAFDKHWNASSKFLRPRIFCLEHAVQIVNMLQCKGGANVLIICHSDYQKMKAHARAVAEETHSTFDYNEVPLEIASPENLTLIDLAIVAEQHDESEDWTSKLGINLRYCVNARHNSPSRQVPWTLDLGMLFPDKHSDLEFLSLNWQLRRSRSKRLNHSAQTKTCDKIQRNKDCQLEGRKDGSTVKKIVIHYSRRKFKSKQSCSSGLSMVHTFQEKSTNVSAVLSGKHYDCASKCEFDTSNFRSECALSGVSASTAMSPTHHEMSTKNLDDEVHKEYQSTCKSNNEEATLSTVSLVNQPMLASMDESFESPNNNYAAEKVSDGMSLKETTGQEINSMSGRDKEPLGDDKPISEYTPNSEVCEVPRQPFAAPVLNDTVMDAERQCQAQNKRELIGEPVSSYVAKGENSSVTLSELGCSEVSVEACPEEDSFIQFISDKGRELEIQPTDRRDEEICSGTKTPLKDSSVSIQECSNLNGSEVHLLQDNSEPESSDLTAVVPHSSARKKRKREVEQLTENQSDCSNFIRSPCEGLRPRAGKVTTDKRSGESSQNDKEHQDNRRARRVPVPHKNKTDDVKKPHSCDLDGCEMSFTTKTELQLHKRNICPHKGCGKKFSSHKYTLLHQRVHDDERPLKCPWNGCSMTFKWAWARTEHIRVHTGEKPYQCKVEGCGLSFRFVSDFSRHRRKTGHYVQSS
ncbi:PREDICTED: probable lysine-specific demethylase ELF6 isoform X2 [Lupinus angustifolius]|uniref:probable lysine-specific demethylase ELF6 isoform X2 n=1 Tax=Lupinus angustifolius TaxID=3871 RepID=UPI00092E97F9|nr:PREDICTED: probable lysine-specific demethylase ELF6 isoform X2 [Lupinus angustifolius]